MGRGGWCGTVLPGGDGVICDTSSRGPGGWLPWAGPGPGAATAPAGHPHQPTSERGKGGTWARVGAATATVLRGGDGAICGARIARGASLWVGSGLPAPGAARRRGGGRPGRSGHPYLNEEVDARGHGGRRVQMDLAGMRSLFCFFPCIFPPFLLCFYCVVRANPTGNSKLQIQPINPSYNL